MKFYLGTHEAHWLSRVDVPLFISHVRLRRRTMMPKANTGWALDSGGFSELDRHSRWETQLEDYVAAVVRYRSEIGHLEWAAPMDWMCEPHMLEKTGKTVREHQRLTVQNFLELRTTGLPFIPVLQGWTDEDYHYCVDLYRWCGVRLEDEPLVGVGSVCRRQHSQEIKQVISGLANRGLRLHGFGVKTKGFPLYANHLTSADSMSWSFNARKNPPLPTCTHKRCNNCMDYALAWRRRLLRAPRQPDQEDGWVALG